MANNHFTAHIEIKQVTFEDVPAGNPLDRKITKQERTVLEVLDVAVKANTYEELVAKVKGHLDV